MSKCVRSTRISFGRIPWYASTCWAHLWLPLLKSQLTSRPLVGVFSMCGPLTKYGPSLVLLNKACSADIISQLGCTGAYRSTNLVNVMTPTFSIFFFSNSHVVVRRVFSWSVRSSGLSFSVQESLLLVDPTSNDCLERKEKEDLNKILSVLVLHHNTYRLRRAHFLRGWDMVVWGQELKSLKGMGRCLW